MRRARDRAGQCACHLRARSSAADQATVDSFLGLAWVARFRRMTSSERAHTLRILSWLAARGHARLEQLQAALLHDVGKH